jgi:UPF0755 protein
MFKKYLSTVFVLIFGVLVCSFAFYGYQIVKSPNILVAKQDRYIFIPEGATFKTVQDMLKKEDITTNLVAFSFLAKLMNYDQMIKPGKYLLKSNMTNQEAIRMLRLGAQEPVNITFNNIRLSADIAEKITKNTGMDTDQFNAALVKFTQNNSADFNEKTVIGMFIPNTYEVYYNISADQLIDRMHAEYNTFWNADRKALAKALNLTQKEVSVLASIVQAESIAADEKQRIAGLYINRLKRGIALQADPTLVFASGDFTLKRVLNIHKEVDSPYNTYKNRGLPPGPINMPTISSIDAVLKYEDHNYIYMCAKEDFSGHHNFATNLRQHNINAQKYQRALSIEMRKARNNQ